MLSIFSIIPSLKNNEGHSYEYNVAFTKAANINGWKYIKIIPKSCSLDGLGSDWQKSIFGMETKNKLKNLKNFVPFLKIFRVFYYCYHFIISYLYFIS